MGAHHSGDCAHHSRIDRRSFLGLLGLGAASVLAGCDIRSTHAEALAGRAHPGSALASPPDTIAPGPPSSAVSPGVPAEAPIPSTTVATIPPPVPGSPQVFSHGPSEATAARQVAITIDDGFCAECVNAYVTLAQETGIHITFDPNGCYGHIWTPLAPKLAPLIESGQVQIGNHTFNHPQMTRLSESQITAQLERNEEWIQKTFGITARPWWRPPYGVHDKRTDEIAASIGYTNVLMWNGTYGDSALLTTEVLLAQARKYLEPGVVMLGHANHPTVTHLFPQIAEIIASRDLNPVTLDEMFGTNRATGRSYSF